MKRSVWASARREDRVVIRKVRVWAEGCVVCGCRGGIEARSVGSETFCSIDILQR